METQGTWAPSELDAFAQRHLGALGCEDFGIVVREGADSWHTRERGFIQLPCGTATVELPILHDDRGAPYAADEKGNELPSLLVSLTDEQDTIAAVWAKTGERSSLMGLGIDLCSAEHFERRGGKYDIVRLLLTDHERDLAPMLDAERPTHAYAMLFAAKEAAFKATAAPLRRWYDSHDEELLFEVRHFVMGRPGEELGTGRNAAAQRAMEKMGIRRIEVHHTQVGEMVLTVACALS